MARIELKRLAKSFGKTSVLRALDLEVRDGEFFCLVGPSGCGKSTALNLVAGLEQADDGEILFDGEAVGRLGPGERDVAMVFQSYALYPHKTVEENIAFPLKARKLPRLEIEKRVRKMAETLGLAGLLSRKPGELSGGQQQRVALGRALVRQPRVFLLDEPLSNLDAALRTQTRLELKRLHETIPVTTLYVTHDQEEAMSLSNRLAVLDRGELQQVGTPVEVYEKPANLFVARFMGRPPMNAFPARVSSGALEAQGSRLASGLRLPDGEVLVGIRPEYLELGRQGGVAAKVTAVEAMGAETWVEAQWGREKLLARVAGRAELSSKDEVSLSWEPGRLHFFDARTQRRIP